MDQILRHNFNVLTAEEVVEKKKYPPPFSLRLTYEERVHLESEADGKPLGAYIRERWYAAFWPFYATYLATRFGDEWCLSYLMISNGLRATLNFI